jgi:uncharacterized repeat protein (TIGR03803 family)
MKTKAAVRNSLGSKIMRSLFTFAFAATGLLLATAPRAQAFSEYVLYNFTGKADGGNPVGGVVQDASGNYYGTTFQGGSYSCPNPPYNKQGCGTIYRLAPDGTFTVLSSFTGANGAHGNSTPILIGNTLYGTTALGGSANAGAIFSVHTDGTDYTLLHQFTGTDGSSPQTLVPGRNNVLHGIAANGGAYGYGDLFSISTTGAYTDLYDFNQPVSATPVSLIAVNGTLVGSTFYGGGSTSSCHTGCGTIFTYVPATKTFTTVYTFPSSDSLGNLPYVGSVGPGPTIYGANTYQIFSLSAATGYTNLLTLDFYANGVGVNSGPLYTQGGILYGTLGGNADLPSGLVYSLLNGVFTVQGDFSGSEGVVKSGAAPDAQPIINADGNLVGTTALDGKCDNCGAIWLSIPGPAQ